jgi:hypothetical protein
MIALALTTVLAWARRTRMKGAAGALLAGETLIGAGFAIAIGILAASRGRIIDAWIAIPALAVALLPWMSLSRRRLNRWLVLQPTAYVLLILLFFGVFIQPQEDDRSAKRVAAELLNLSRQPGHTLLVTKLPEEVSVYLPLDVKYAPMGTVLIVVDDSHGVHDRERHHQPVPPPEVSRFSALVPDAEVVAVQRVPITAAPGDARWKVYALTVKSGRRYARID